MKPEIKKMLILNAPYLIFVYAFDKIGQAFRLAPGADLTGKLLSIGDGFSAAPPVNAALIRQVHRPIPLHKSDNLLGTPAGACRIPCQREGHFRMSHTGAGFPSSLFY